ncbi:MAG: hypothetical protein WBP56_10330 [Polyangia bacterium]
MKKIAKKQSLKEAEPYSLTLALGEVIGRELREFVVSAGMEALTLLLERERTEACGPRYQHQPDRLAVRAGHAPGELVMGGRRVRVARPRARTLDGREVELRRRRSRAAAFISRRARREAGPAWTAAKIEAMISSPRSRVFTSTSARRRNVKSWTRS